MSGGGPALSNRGHRMVTLGNEMLGVVKTARAGEVLRVVLRAAVESPPGAADGIGSVPYRASAALYSYWWITRWIGTVGAGRVGVRARRSGYVVASAECT